MALKIVLEYRLEITAFTFESIHGFRSVGLEPLLTGLHDINRNIVFSSAMLTIQFLLKDWKSV